MMCVLIFSARFSNVVARSETTQNPSAAMSLFGPCVGQ